MKQKFKVYVKDGDKVKLVRFGHQGKGNEKTMKIKKSIKRSKSRARHNCKNQVLRLKHVIGHVRLGKQ